MKNLKVKKIMFDNKVLLITGGTGSFGNAVLKRFLDSSIAEVRIFSRDEKKQDDMRKKFANDKIKFYLGDVRDADSLRSAMRGVDYVFHAAALKQVPSCEFYPMQAVKTNVIGTENVLEAAIEYGVDRVICLSTDKAVYPINAMGISKAMMEKIAVAKSRESGKTCICVTRYGNVMASRGSVIPLFLNQIKRGVPLTVTDPDMTRFMMTLNDAVDLVVYAFQNGESGDVFVQKSPSVTIGILVEAMKSLMESPEHSVDVIGTRHGEKLYEALLSREELAVSQDLGDYYRVSPDFRGLNYDRFIELGEKKISSSDDYNSHNSEQLDINEMKTLLGKLDEFQAMFVDPAIKKDI